MNPLEKTLVGLLIVNDGLDQFLDEFPDLEGPLPGDNATNEDTLRLDGFVVLDFDDALAFRYWTRHQLSILESTMLSTRIKRAKKLKRAVLAAIARRNQDRG